MAKSAREQRFLSVASILIDNGYRLYPVDNYKNILWAEHGSFSQGAHQSSYSEETNCVLYIPYENFTFADMANIYDTPTLRNLLIYAITPFHIAFIKGEYNRWEEVDTSIQSCCQRPNIWFPSTSKPNPYRLGWATDIHMNFLETDAFSEFSKLVQSHHLNALLISGDMAENHDVYGLVDALQKAIQIPIYFVLGNHDYYGSGFAKTNQAMREFLKERRDLIWLTDVDIISPTSDIAIIGHESWADGRNGDYIKSSVVMLCYYSIDELSTARKNNKEAKYDKRAAWQKVQEISDIAAVEVRKKLDVAFANHDRAILAMHFPPFVETCTVFGKIADDEYLPHFSCQVMGKMLQEFMREHSTKNLLCVCGHTHDRAARWILPNLLSLTGAAEYGKPCIQAVFEL